jgi:uncharacterized protein (TIGR02996 family)
MAKAEQSWLKRLSAAPDDSEIRLGYAKWLATNERKDEASLLKLSVEKTALNAKSSNISGPGLSGAERSRWYAIQDELLDLSHRVDPSWIVRIDSELAIPPGLSKLGLEATRTIIDFLSEEGWTYSGTGRAFYNPANWSPATALTPAAVLVVIHGEGLLDECLGFVSGHESQQQRLVDRLNEIGAWSELFDGSTSIINPNDYPGFAIGLDFKVRN